MLISETSISVELLPRTPDLHREIEVESREESIPKKKEEPRKGGVLRGRGVQRGITPPLEI